MKNRWMLAGMAALGLMLSGWGVLAQGEKPVTKSTPTQQVPAAKIKDPVCGMELEAGKAKEKSTYNKKTYQFCSAGCKAKFDKDPAKYAKQ